MLFRTLFMESPQIELPSVAYSREGGKDTKALNTYHPEDASVSYAGNSVQSTLIGVVLESLQIENQITPVGVIHHSAIAEEVHRCGNSFPSCGHHLRDLFLS